MRSIKKGNMKDLNRRSFLNRVLLAVPLLAIKPLENFHPVLDDYSMKDLMGNQPADGDNYVPGYVRLHRSGELKIRAQILTDFLTKCNICPRDCLKDRTRGQIGDCNADARLRISSFSPHFGEERSLVGRRGSGTIFFSHCNLLCVFCLNWQINHFGAGTIRTINELASMMLSLQRMGCHNINVVTPTHYSPQILSALDIAASRGLNIPLVYNSSGWEKIEILQLLDGVVDIYLPDFKYFESEMANKYSQGAECYPEVTKRAILEMHRQVGRSRLYSSDGLKRRGLMIRHLVMPNNVGGSVQVMNWIAKNLPADTYVNIMAQYTPVFRANEFPAINRRINAREYTEVVNAARRFGLTNLDIQGSI